MTKETKNKIVDMRAVTCGLVPGIVAQLDATSARVVDFHIRTGIREEIMSGFGSGGAWNIEIITDLGFDILRFYRRKPSSLESLNIVNY
ncbi:hypothetical protein [Maridesulfovibrio frigidus]|uniref:hypothetical protein n=1 Tax=Maridesulfovibrio frigidus TaxID=340956 RepID=UPI0004E139BE|nr:hypothetical protein [Maridesulfovibrio frigidus]